MSAESPEAFVRHLSEDGRQTLSALKSEVDRLVTCDLSKASRLVDRTERVAEIIGDPVCRALAAACRARVLHRSGRHAEANSLYESAIQVLREAGLKGEAATIQKPQVAALIMLGRYDDALRTARAARRVLARREPVELAQLETNIGHIYYRLDRYRQALQHYDRARGTLARSGDASMCALVDFSRSNVLLEMDRPYEALALLEEAASVFDGAGQLLQAAQSRFHMAYIEFLLGNYNKALAGYYRVRDQLAELGSTQLVAQCNLDIAEILLVLNSFEDAAENAATAQTTFNELAMPYDSARASMARGLALMAVEQQGQALASLSRARQAFADSGNRTFTALADCYLAELSLRQGEPSEANRRASQALRAFARQGLVARAAYARLLVARAAYSGGDLRKAARAARMILDSASDIHAPVVVYQCHHLLGRIARDRGQPRAAIDHFRAAVATIEGMRTGIAVDEFKATFLRDKIAAYEDAIGACLDQGTDEGADEAFRLVELSKSRALAELLARYARGVAGAGLPPEVRERLSRLIEELNWYTSQNGLEDDKGDQRRAESASRYRREIARCERQIAQLLRRAGVERSGFGDGNLAYGASATDLISALGDGETAIEFFTIGDEVSAFVLSDGKLSVIRGIASGRHVEHLAASMRFQIEKFNYGSDYVNPYFGQLKRSTDQYLTQLHELLFAPLEGVVDGDRLVVIPHGALHYIPFHALRSDGRYLIERFEISYAPSATVLRLCKQRKPSRVKRDSMVALGLAERGTPSIEEEIDALGALFPDSVCLTGNRATRENLMQFAPRARFLHLASHGYFRRDNPMFSFLKLADSNLNFYSLLDMNLNAEMVTLSACQTGVNAVFPGDELHGLMRGFLSAGAPSLVVSLWAVNDRSTADLMLEMYKRIGAGETKRQALRHAQLAVRDQYGHPYYWAPFLLMGNPN
jgi:tetratricopeptide (TPR) repeat protein